MFCILEPELVGQIHKRDTVPVPMNTNVRIFLSLKSASIL